MTRSDDEMEHNWRIKGNILINVIHETESRLSDENYENLLHYIQLSEILSPNVS
jgi:hypothetical protein